MSGRKCNETELPRASGFFGATFFTTAGAKFFREKLFSKLSLACIDADFYSYMDQWEDDHNIFLNDCLLKVNKQDFLKLFQGSGIGKMVDNS